MGAFRLYPDPQSWASMVERALAGDKEAQADVAVLGPERDRMIEDAVSAGGSGGGGGGSGSALTTGLVTSYDNANKTAVIGGVTMDNYTGFALNANAEVVYDAALNVVIGMRSNGVSPPPTHTAAALYTDYPLGPDTHVLGTTNSNDGVGFASMGDEMMGEWFVDYNDTYGTADPVITVRHTGNYGANTANPRIYQIGTNSDTSIALPSGASATKSSSGMLSLDGTAYWVQEGNVYKLNSNLTWTLEGSQGTTSSTTKTSYDNVSGSVACTSQTNNEAALFIKPSAALNGTIAIPTPDVANFYNSLISGDNYIWTHVDSRASATGTAASTRRLYWRPADLTSSWTLHSTISTNIANSLRGALSTRGYCVTPNGQLIRVTSQGFDRYDRNGNTTTYTGLYPANVTNANFRILAAVAVSDTEVIVAGAWNVKYFQSTWNGSAAVIWKLTATTCSVLWSDVPATNPNQSNNVGFFANNLVADEQTAGVYRWSAVANTNSASVTPRDATLYRGAL